MEEFDLEPDPVIPPAPIKGRGAVGNIDHRFTTTTRQAESDGWDSPVPAHPKTRLHDDHAKSIISRNDSPDLAFSLTLNPYRGCEHGCIYCYARPTHAWLGLSPGLDFETQIFRKPDAPRLLREALARPDYVCTPITLGAATDAYQPFERREGLTRALLDVALAAGQPVSVVTKSALIQRDLDLWSALAARGLGQVGISLTTLDGSLARQLEPRASAPQARLQAIEALTRAGVPVTVLASPLIPGLNDHELEKLLGAARDCGASHADYTLLRLPHEVADLFQEWLAWHAPEKAARIMSVLYDLRGGRVYDARFGNRMKGLGHFAELLRQRFELACRRLGLQHGWSALDCSQFKPSYAPDTEVGGQMSLF